MYRYRLTYYLITGGSASERLPEVHYFLLFPQASSGRIRNCSHLYIYTYDHFDGSDLVRRGINILYTLTMYKSGESMSRLIHC
jgi:hypothetical protein